MSNKGTEQPLPGRCGAKLRNTDPPRYCAIAPLNGRNRCRLHGGKSPRGVASPSYRHGKKSKYDKVAPESIRKHLLASPLADIASQREEIALMDARVAEILESTASSDPVRTSMQMEDALSELNSALTRQDLQSAEHHAKRLSKQLGRIRVAAMNWQEIRATMKTRNEMTRTELGFQKLLSDKILIEHIDTFVRAITQEARTLPVERMVLAAYADRVMLHAKRLMMPALEHTAGVIEAESRVLPPQPGEGGS